VRPLKILKKKKYKWDSKFENRSIIVNTKQSHNIKITVNVAPDENGWSCPAHRTILQCLSKKICGCPFFYFSYPSVFSWFEEVYGSLFQSFHSKNSLLCTNTYIQTKRYWPLKFGIACQMKRCFYFLSGCMVLQKNSLKIIGEPKLYNVENSWKIIEEYKNFYDTVTILSRK